MPGGGAEIKMVALAGKSRGTRPLVFKDKIRRASNARTQTNSILKIAICISVRCKSQPRFHQHSFIRLTDPPSDRPETWPSGGSRHSKCPQPQFHAPQCQGNLGW